MKSIRKYYKILIPLLLVLALLFIYLLTLKSHSSFKLTYLNEEEHYTYQFNGDNLETLSLIMEEYDSEKLKNTYPLGKVNYPKNKSDQGTIKLSESKDSLDRVKLSMRINSEHFTNYGEIDILDSDIDLTDFQSYFINTEININQSNEFELLKFQKDNQLYIIKIKVELYQ